MIVYKFGGTSVGTPQSMHRVAELVSDEQPKIVVLSALAGTTNALVEISRLHHARDIELAMVKIGELRKHYDTFLAELYDHPLSDPLGWQIIEDHFQRLVEWVQSPPTKYTERLILAQGELISTALFHYLLMEQGIKTELLSALDFMQINEDLEPNYSEIEERFHRTVATLKPPGIWITQGYICKDELEQVTNLQRGGSDYTATILGAILQAEEIQIWTDIDGVHNNDPRIVKNTHPIKQLSYREAAELAYFGAKILHPTCVLPAEKKGVPIRLKNTMDPEAPGTLISKESSHLPIAAIAAKDGITVFHIYSRRMLMAYGFLRKVFEVFETHRTPIDMIATSEVSVSLTIDDSSHIDAILKDLKPFGTVSVERDQTIICIVGDALDQLTGYAKKIFDALSSVKIKMISYGGSKNNVSILIDNDKKAEALTAINQHLF